MSTDPEHSVSTQPGGGHDGHRRVSIADGPHGHDNPAFESPRSRKVSAASEHAEIGPVRKKSILHHAHGAENTTSGGGKTVFFKFSLHRYINSFNHDQDKIFFFLKE